MTTNIDIKSHPSNLQELIKVMRVYADDGLKALIEAKSKKAKNFLGEIIIINGKYQKLF